MTVPDAIYEQTGSYHEFCMPDQDGAPRYNWLELYLREDHISLYTVVGESLSLDLNLNDARILRDILTEHIARQDRKPA